MGIIKVVSPARAGRIIDRRLAGIEKRGFAGRAALARLIRPGNIAASFGGGELSGISQVARPESVSRLAGLGLKMIEIPAGEFVFQDTSGVYLPAFRIGKTPVINAQYAEFIKETGREAPAYWRDARFGIETKDEAGNLIGPQLPVVGVSNHDAKAFAEWAGVRLLTEFEWEKAARGTKGLEYPFGNEFDQSRVVFDSDGTQPVNREGVERGASPYEVLDMAGNVWEWTDSWHGKVDLSDRRNPKGPEKGNTKVLRGGSWSYDFPDGFRSASRGSFHPGSSNYYVGFRVAEDV